MNLESVVEATTVVSFFVLFGIFLWREHQWEKYEDKIQKEMDRNKKRRIP